MGTRGLFGFVYQGKYYVVYNHWDSYPVGLGRQLILELVNAIRQNQLDSWKDKLSSIQVIDPKSEPTKQDIEKLSSYTDLGVSNQSVTDWYCLTRSCQGSWISVLESGYLLPHHPVSHNLQIEILFEEYTYLLDFDQEQFRWFISSDEQSAIPLDQLSDKVFSAKWLKESKRSSRHY